MWCSLRSCSFCFHIFEEIISHLGCYVTAQHSTARRSPTVKTYMAVLPTSLRFPPPLLLALILVFFHALLVHFGWLIDVVEGARLEVQHLEKAKKRVLCCAACRSSLAWDRDVFALPGAEGTIGAYVNPEGYVHQVKKSRCWKKCTFSVSRPFKIYSDREARGMGGWRRGRVY